MSDLLYDKNNGLIMTEQLIRDYLETLDWSEKEINIYINKLKKDKTPAPQSKDD